MKKFIGFIVLVMTTCFQLRSQHTEGNPFARLGYKADVYTFGEKSEFHDREEVVEIGDVLFNTRTNEVVGFVKEDVDSLIELKPELQSMSIDPHCEKYYSITPYAYCLNNPVRFIDPDGRQVVGLTKDDALKVQQDLNTLFAGEKFDKFRGLLTLDKKGTTFNSISSEAMKGAFEGITLNADEQALVNEVAGVINAESIHKVEFVSIDGAVSKEGTSAFKAHLNKIQTGLGDAMIPSANMPGATMNAASGGGINIPTKNGSHSVIMEGKGVIHDGGRAVTTGHEVVGHGVASANKVTPLENNTRAIRVDNLIRRVMGITTFRTEHGGAIIVNPYALP